MLMMCKDWRENKYRLEVAIEFMTKFVASLRSDECVDFLFGSWVWSWT